MNTNGDDAEKIKSITVAKGFICFAWLEEASEVAFDEFDKIDKSLRAQMPEGYYIQWLITFNPTSANSWLKSFFFDNPRDNVLTMTTTYQCNEWLSPDFLELMEFTRKTDPDRYKVDGLGEWGLGGGQYFSMWRESLHVVKPFKIPREWVKFRAMDFGTARPYAVLWFAIDYDGNAYVYRELYGWGGKPNVGTGETARQIGEKIVEVENREEDLRYGVLDSACWARTGVTGPTIAEEINDVLIRKGLTPFIASSKGRLEGANAFKQRLIGNEIEEGNYKPAIKFFSTCIHCLRTIPMIGHDKHKPELPDTDAEDHCFVAGTLIHTTRGTIPIEEVTTADKVLTRKGYRKVLAAGITKRSAKVITATFSNGKYLTGTKNHPIFIKGKGFAPLDTVKYGDIIYPASEVDKLCRENKPQHPNLLCSTVSLSGVTPTQNICRAECITQLADTCICTAKFGSTITAKSLKVITFTTKTEMRLITTFLIWNWLKVMNMFQRMCAKISQMPSITNVLKNIWLISDKKLLSGIGQKKGESGTANTGLNAQNTRLKNRKLNVYAPNAAKNFMYAQKRLPEANIVQMLVAQSIDATTGLMTRPESVSCAAKSLEQIDSAKPKPVAENAEVSVVAIRDESKTADVYNLTVDEEHEYFANGFLVHNCYDAVAYGCMSRPWVPVRKSNSWRAHDAWSTEDNKKSLVWTL